MDVSEPHGARVYAGMAVNARAGRFNGGHTRYGLAYDRASREVIPHPTEAFVVRRIHEWRYRDGLTQEEILERLSRERIPTRSGKARWNRKQLTRILGNPAYAGTYRWDCIEKRGAYEPIVTPAEIARWQTQARRRGREGQRRDARSRGGRPRPRLPGVSD